jgi:hypothetical protein
MIFKLNFYWTLLFYDRTSNYLIIFLKIKVNSKTFIDITKVIRFHPKKY